MGRSRPRFLQRLDEHPSHFHWPAHLAKLLGKIPDDALARKAGVHPQTVLKERRRRGIPPSRPCRPPIRWTPRMLSLLGTASDADVATTLGLSTGSVSVKRRRLGIPSYHEPSPNVRSYPWPPRAVALLGKLSDRAVAQRLGLSHATVWHRRVVLGIPSFRPRKVVRWTRTMLKLLGKISDSQIALRFGITKLTVKDKRTALQIAPFREPPRKRLSCRIGG